MEPARTSGLGRDLDILDVLAAEDTVRRGGLGVVAIADRLGRQNSQVSRALQALREAGMVERDARTATYRLGWRLYSYAARTAESRLVHLAGPTMRRLVAGLGETTHLCVLREFRVLTLWTEAAPHGFRSSGWEGVPVDVPGTSAGQVLVSDWEPTVLATWYPALGDTAPRLLADVRRRGYAVVRHEFEPGVVGCSAPVRDANAGVVAALNVSAPQERLDRRLEEAGRLTAAAAAELSRALHSDAGDRR